MKCERVFLCEWLGDSTDGYNDIPWPMVHEWVGSECIQWINRQRHTDCQMIIEKGRDFNHGFIRLYVEFFKDSLRTEFALRFAK